MQKLLLNTARYDRMRGGVLIDTPGKQVLVAHNAIEDYYGRSFDHEEAVEMAVEAGPLLRLVANATPADDGKIIITTGILNHREWVLGTGEANDAD